MLQLRLAAASKVLNAAIRREPGGVPKAHRRLHTKLVLESTQRRSRVEGPVTPRGASEAVLEEHSDDRHHSQAAVCDLRRKLLLLLRRVRGGQPLEAEVARSSRGARRLVLRELAEGTVRNDLRPARGRHLGDRRKAVGDVRELETRRGREITG